MATVPGTPFSNTGGIPKELQPTQADMLLAAGLLSQKDGGSAPSINPSQGQAPAGLANIPDRRKKGGR
jgi:hypothetical protein